MKLSSFFSVYQKSRCLRLSLFTAIAISGFIVGLLIHICMKQAGFYASYEMQYDTLQQASMAMDVMSRELRMAGYNPTAKPLHALTYDANQVAFKADLNGDGDTDDLYEEIRYAYDAETHQLVRTDHTQSQPLVAYIQACRFTYLDRDGTPTTVAMQARQLRITMTMQAPVTAEPYATDDGNATHTLTTLIYLRNLPS